MTATSRKRSHGLSARSGARFSERAEATEPDAASGVAKSSWTTDPWPPTTDDRAAPPPPRSVATKAPPASGARWRWSDRAWGQASRVAITGWSNRCAGWSVPSRAIRPKRKQSMSAGKATPTCAERVQMFAVTDTQLGSSNVPREIHRIPGLLSNVSDTVVPQLPQKLMCACRLPSPAGWLY